MWKQAACVCLQPMAYRTRKELTGLVDLMQGSVIPLEDLPGNVQLGAGSMITGDRISREQAFRRFRSHRSPALVIGERSIMDGVHFNLGEEAYVQIGDDCHFRDIFLICELQLIIGDRVNIGWHVTIVDSDFHPVQPGPRKEDVIALSPLGSGLQRPPHTAHEVSIGDDVWIGPNAIVLKGVRVGAGATIEPGSVVTRDIPAGMHVIGNPARPVSEVEP